MTIPRARGAHRPKSRDELVVLSADDQRALAARASEVAALAATADRPVRQWAAEVTAAQPGGALALAVVGNTCEQIGDKFRHASGAGRSRLHPDQRSQWHFFQRRAASSVRRQGGDPVPG
jgi:acyl transferase domain-containing protein